MVELSLWCDLSCILKQRSRFFRGLPTDSQRASPSIAKLGHGSASGHEKEAAYSPFYYGNRVRRSL